MDRQWFTASWIPLLFLLFLFQGSIIDGFAKGDLSFEYENCSRQNRACLDPKYHITIAFGEKSGNLTLKPENIHAVDLDSLNSSIQYTFLNGTPKDYSDYFEIDSKSGTVKQIKTVSTTKSKRFVITVKAEEEESNRRSTTAQLRIYVKHKICSSASDEQYGYVVENSTAGTKILDKRGQPIVLTVSHNDSCQNDPKVSYTFEVLNNFFTVDSDGYICVNNKILVSDSPSTQNYTFQIKAIRKNGDDFDSLPYPMTIFLNDNNVTEIDKEQNSTIISSSEQGASESEIDRTTELIKTTSQIITYGHYNITDSGGQFTHGVLEFKNNVTEINKEQYSTTSYSTIAVSKKGDIKLELDRTTELIKTTVQVTAEDHVSDNKIQTITSSSASVQANGNNGDSLFNNIYFLIALLVLVLIIAVIVSIVVSYLRCKASKETKENKYQMPYNVTMYTKPCDYVEQLLYTDVNNEYNDSLDYAGYMVLENIDKSGDIHSPVNTMTKTASVNRIGSKATSTDDRSKMAVASKPVVYDYATVGEK